MILLDRVFFLLYCFPVIVIRVIMVLRQIIELGKFICSINLESFGFVFVG